MTTFYDIAISVQTDPRTVKFQNDYADCYNPEYLNLVNEIHSKELTPAEKFSALLDLTQPDCE